MTLFHFFLSDRVACYGCYGNHRRLCDRKLEKFEIFLLRYDFILSLKACIQEGCLCRFTFSFMYAVKRELFNIDILQTWTWIVNKCFHCVKMWFFFILYFCVEQRCLLRLPWTIVVCTMENKAFSFTIIFHFESWTCIYNK